MSANLDSALAALAAGPSPFDRADLPTDRSDALWAEIRAEYRLSLAQTSALKNFACSGGAAAGGGGAAPPPPAVAAAPRVDPAAAKRAADARRRQALQAEVADLKRQLDGAVQRQEFEKCPGLRDSIASKEAELKALGGGGGAPPGPTASFSQTQTRRNPDGSVTTVVNNSGGSGVLPDDVLNSSTAPPPGGMLDRLNAIRDQNRAHQQSELDDQMAAMRNRLGSQLAAQMADPNNMRSSSSTTTTRTNPDGSVSTVTSRTGGGGQPSMLRGGAPQPTPAVQPYRPPAQAQQQPTPTPYRPPAQQQPAVTPYQPPPSSQARAVPRAVPVATPYSPPGGVDDDDDDIPPPPPPEEPPLAGGGSIAPMRRTDANQPIHTQRALAKPPNKWEQQSNDMQTKLANMQAEQMADLQKRLAAFAGKDVPIAQSHNSFSSQSTGVGPGAPQGHTFSTTTQQKGDEVTTSTTQRGAR